ncbi:MAG: LytTR family transcriptional regulator DNA-binding domain-containing protein [Duncaniella sp.]|nr:LytTR family transcriptional regulator DNA-binding domain-containing protein [Duncaniella sp.]
MQIYLSGETLPLLTLSSFSAILGRLPGEFLQVHRSYIVNMNRVCHIERGRVAVGPDTFIPVGDSFKTALNEYVSTRSAGIR